LDVHGCVPSEVAARMSAGAPSCSKLLFMNWEEAYKRVVQKQ